jgi:hypothetical protein
MTDDQLLVVVPALDEADRVPAWPGVPGATVDQDRGPFSDNASTDATPELARSFDDRLDIVVRTVPRLGPTDHFVSAARWGLSSSDAGVCALLAGDDSWDAGFASAALRCLRAHPEVDVV